MSSACSRSSSRSQPSGSTVVPVAEAGEAGEAVSTASVPRGKSEMGRRRCASSAFEVSIREGMMLLFESSR